MILKKWLCFVGCLSGGIGRRTGLKILRSLLIVPVQVWPQAPFFSTRELSFVKINKVIIKNFRGIKNAEIDLPRHGVLVGDNNVGKSTILEAIDLVLGPERIRKKPIIDEHDFFAGDYLNLEKRPVEINIELIIVDLNEDQEIYFKNHLQWWDANKNCFLDGPPPKSTDEGNVSSAIRFSFEGKYDKEEDDFIGDTYFQHPLRDDGEKSPFNSKDKRMCGFLFLRTLRTGSRALSLERGSLLDIILNLNEVKLNMWEEVLKKLREISVADNSESGVTSILSNVQKELSSLVPSDWGTESKVQVSDLTREGLRKVLNVFMETGVENIKGKKHTAPFKKQGAGTVNMLVLSMLSIISSLKQNVIFAMEEPEIAIPPHTQKMIINSIRTKSTQALFTSHSPYVLEEFDPSEIIVLTNKLGSIESKPATFPTKIKRKNYKQEFRKKYCEALLANKVLIVEGRTEYDAIPAAARRLYELNSKEYSSLEALGVAIIDAESDSQIANIGSHLNELGKTTFAIYDKQNEPQGGLIKDNICHPFESPTKGLENIVLTKIPSQTLKRFAISIVSEKNWPSHLSHMVPDESSSEGDIKNSLSKYFDWSKGSGSIANLLEVCDLDEIPQFIKDTIKKIKNIVQQEPATNHRSLVEDSNGH